MLALQRHAGVCGPVVGCAGTSSARMDSLQWASGFGLGCLCLHPGLTKGQGRAELSLGGLCAHHIWDGASLLRSQGWQWRCKPPVGVGP